MTAIEAKLHLAAQLQRVYDALGNRGTVKWTLRDATAVKTLLGETERR